MKLNSLDQIYLWCGQLQAMRFALELLSWASGSFMDTFLVLRSEISFGALAARRASAALRPASLRPASATTADFRCLMTPRDPAAAANGELVSGPPAAESPSTRNLVSPHPEGTRMRIGIVLTILFALQTTSRGEQPVPEWFKFDAARPQDLFEAWKHLTTRDAVLHAWPSLTGWYVVGGVLVDEKGAPIPHCPLQILYVNFKAYSARLMTDANGHFVIYSPFAKPAADDRTQTFYACPGYPYSEQGIRFAGTRREMKPCSVQVTSLSDQHCFCTLTCTRQSTFNKAEFEEFQQQELRQFEQRTPKVWRHPPKPPEAPSVDVLQTRYRLRLVSPEGKPIPDARVIFNTEHAFISNHQSTATDAHGECTLEERLPATLTKDLQNRVERYVSIDAQRFGVGPLAGPLKPDELNVICMREPASISGRLVDHNGQPVRAHLSVRYKHRCLCTFELHPEIAPDGSFEFHRMIPGEEFKLVSTRTETEWFTLEPGESRTDVTLSIPLAAALRGLILDQDGNPVTTHCEYDVEHDGSGRWSFAGTTTHGLISACNLKPGAVRIRVEAKGFRRCVSDELKLEPGELRFFRMHLEPGAQRR